MQRRQPRPSIPAARCAARSAAAAAALALAAASASAQAWPSRPVSLVVPFPPGGTTDVLARSQPGKMAHGSNGNGSTPMAIDLLGGQIAMSFDTVTPVLPHIRSGRLRALAVTTAKPSSVPPEVLQRLAAGSTRIIQSTERFAKVVREANILPD